MMNRKIRKGLIIIMTGAMLAGSVMPYTAAEEPAASSEEVKETANAAEEAAAKKAAEEAAAKKAAEEAAAQKAAEEAAAQKAAEEAAAQKAAEAAAAAAAEEAAAQAAANAAAAEPQAAPEPAPAQSAQPAAENSESASDVKEKDKKEDKKDTDKKDEEVPVFTGTVRAEREEKTDLHLDDITTLKVIVERANLPYKVRWEIQKVKNDDNTWTPIGEGEKFQINVTEENKDLFFRAVLTFGDTGAAEVPSPAMALPELKPVETDDNKEETASDKTEGQKDHETETGDAKTEKAEDKETEELPDLDGSAGDAEADKAAEGVTETAAEKTEEKKSETAEKIEDDADEETVKDEPAAEKEPEIAQSTQDEIAAAAEETEAVDGDEQEEPVGTVVTTARSNVRTEADGLSPIYTIAPEGTALDFYGMEGDWAKVFYEGQFGYIFKTILSGLPEEEPELDENGEPVEKEKKVTIFSSRWTKCAPGANLALTSVLEGFEDCEEILYQWMVNKGDGFEEIEGANKDTYYFTATEENLEWGWKLIVYYK